MAQSVELTLDAAADARLTEQWARLADAGLPTSQRTRAESGPPTAHHAVRRRRHPARRGGGAARGWSAGLDLTVRVGSVMLFGPRRNRYVLVRQVVVSAELLDLQRRIADLCEAVAGRSVRARPLDAARDAGAPHPGRAGQPRPRACWVRRTSSTTRVTACRRWDGERRTAWWLTR